MKKLILSMAVSLISLSAHADLIHCAFTEPFINSSYDLKEQTLTYENPFGDSGKKEITVIKNVSFQIVEAGVFNLVSQENKILQILKLNHQGSDGMSETIYPFDVQELSGLFANPLYGGCLSDRLKALK